MASLPETYKAIVAQPGGAEPKLEDVKLEKPGQNQILVKIDYAPINPADVMTIQDIYPTYTRKPHTVGLEGSGTVVAVGEGLKVSHQIGDKVHVLGLRTWAQYCLADSEMCDKVQEGVSQEAAASHIVNPGTVILFADTAEAKKAKCAIHTAGASSLGRMMIRYFKKRGIKLINIVRRDEYVEELKKAGADYALNSQSPNFEQELKEIAEKEGATVCFECITGDLTAKVLKNMPESSTLYIYGGLAGPTFGNIGFQNFLFQDKTISGLWLVRALTGDPELAAKIVKESHSLLNDELSTEVQKVFTLEEWKEALEMNDKGSSKGKVLLKPN